MAGRRSRYESDANRNPAGGKGRASANRERRPDSPKFEIVSIKRHELPAGQFVFRFATAPGGGVLETKGNRFTENVATLQDLLTDAYGVKDYQIFGLADWGKSPMGEHFDIDARVEGEATPTSDQLRLMLQSLLADRFQLKLRREMRELPVYALVVSEKGSKLRAVSDEELRNVPRYATPPTERPARIKSTITSLINLISRYADRPVVDRTDLAGGYDQANLDWQQFAEERRTDPLAQASVFAAIQDQLGLKLEPRKDSTEVLVIEHVERAFGELNAAAPLRGASVFVEPVDGALPGQVGGSFVVALGRGVAVEAVNGAGIDVSLVRNVRFF